MIPDDFDPRVFDLVARNAPACPTCGGPTELLRLCHGLLPQPHGAPTYQVHGHFRCYRCLNETPTECRGDFVPSEMSVACFCMYEGPGRDDGDAVRCPACERTMWPADLACASTPQWALDVLTEIEADAGDHPTHTPSA